MRYQGTLQRDGKWWLAEVPIFDAMTQGRSRGEALAMVADLFVTMTNSRKSAIKIYTTGRYTFEIGSGDAKAMISLLLRRQRQKNGLTLEQAAAALGARSRNAYARYEQGLAMPTVAKLDELMRAVSPHQDIVLTQSDAA